jgi:hypothetical protein
MLSGNGQLSQRQALSRLHSLLAVRMAIGGKSGNLLRLLAPSALLKSSYDKGRRDGWRLSSHIGGERILIRSVFWAVQGARVAYAAWEEQQRNKAYKAEIERLKGLLEAHLWSDGCFRPDIGRVDENGLTFIVTVIRSREPTGLPPCHVQLNNIVTKAERLFWYDPYTRRLIETPEAGAA